MSKKLGSTTLDKKNIKGLQGFEDVFEDYVESEEYKAVERKEKESTKTAEQYEMQTFLEQENARLTALEVFLSKKVTLNTNFSQTDKLILKQLERIKELEEKLSNEFKKPDSHFQKNLAHFFNSHFS